jgi:hypothetical protein
LHDSTAFESSLRNTYVQATTAVWLGSVICQPGTAIAARTQIASLLSIGSSSGPLLPAIVAELPLTFAIIDVPFLTQLFDADSLYLGRVAGVPFVG